MNHDPPAHHKQGAEGVGERRPRQKQLLHNDGRHMSKRMPNNDQTSYPTQGPSVNVTRKAVEAVGSRLSRQFTALLQG